MSSISARPPTEESHMHRSALALLFWIMSVAAFAIDRTGFASVTIVVSPYVNVNVSQISPAFQTSGSTGNFQNLNALFIVQSCDASGRKTSSVITSNSNFPTTHVATLVNSILIDSSAQRTVEGKQVYFNSLFTGGVLNARGSSSGTLTVTIAAT